MAETRKKKVSKKKIMEAVVNSHGLKVATCELLGIARPTLDRYIAADPEIEEAIFSQRVRWKDRAEYKLHEAIERGESWAIMFTLKNAKDREYSDRMDITSGERPIEFDYAKFINTAPRPTEDSPAPGEDQGSVHGETLGQDGDGGGAGGGGV